MEKEKGNILKFLLAFNNERFLNICARLEVCGRNKILSHYR